MPMKLPQPTALWRLAAWAGALAIGLGVLMLYTRPDFMRMLADQLWACF